MQDGEDIEVFLLPLDSLYTSLLVCHFLRPQASKTLRKAAPFFLSLYPKKIGKKTTIPDEGGTELPLPPAWQRTCTDTHMQKGIHASHACGVLVEMRVVRYYEGRSQYGICNCGELVFCYMYSPFDRK